MIAALEPTFGVVNLEDIKAPDCFYVERELRKRMKIPVFHDDQHGTAITLAMVSALAVTGKDIGRIKLVTSGAGAAALACLNLLLKLGLEARQRLRHRPGGRILRRPHRAWTKTSGSTRARPNCAACPRSPKGPTCSSACRPAVY